MIYEYSTHCTPPCRRSIEAINKPTNKIEGTKNKFGGTKKNIGGTREKFEGTKKNGSGSESFFGATSAAKYNMYFWQGKICRSLAGYDMPHPSCAAIILCLGQSLLLAHAGHRYLPEILRVHASIYRLGHPLHVVDIEACPRIG